MANDTLFPLEEPQHALNTGQNLSQIIRRVFIYANPSKPNTSNCLKELVSTLKKLGIESLIYNTETPSHMHMSEYISQALNIPMRKKSKECHSEGSHSCCTQGAARLELNGCEIFDLVITVGGDGTVLKYLAYSPFPELPILPINTGSLGYITSISFDKLEEQIQSIFSGCFVYSPRLQLEAKLLDKDDKPKHCRSYFALNEVAIGACRTGLFAEMELQIEESSIPVQGDGIVVATPTGSTAYSLAAGGPIVNSEMEALIITPVSPFSLATRPVVTPSHVNLFIRNGGNHKLPLLVAIDGWALGELLPGESVHITGSKERIQFIATSHNNSYIENIRTKLGWHNVAHHRTPE